MKNKIIFIIIMALLLSGTVYLANAQECNITGFSGPYLKSWSRTEYLVWWEDYPFGLQPGLYTGSATFHRSTPEGVIGKHSDIPFRGYACNGQVAWWTQEIDFNKLDCGSWTVFNPRIEYENGTWPIRYNPDVGFRSSQNLGCNLYESILFKNHTPAKLLSVYPYPPPYPYP